MHPPSLSDHSLGTGLGFATGQVPGAAVYTGPARDFQPHRRIWVYDSDDVQRPEELPATRPPGSILWVDVEGVHDVDLIKGLGRTFGLHALVVEDIVAPGQRVKIERHTDSLVYTVRMLVPGATEPEQLTMVQAADYVLTFQEVPGDNFDSVRERLKTGGGLVRRKPGAYLAYALLDAVVDGFALIQKAIEDQISQLEDELDVAGNPDDEIPTRIHAVKRDLMNLRRSTSPLRDEVGRLIRDNHPLITAEVMPYFRDLHDHLIQVCDAVDLTRETARSLMELHVSNVSQKMNEDMRVLTVVGTIFIPLTFLAGIYGMNFEHMPELGWRYSYPIFWGLVLLIFIALGIFFRRRRWL